jgi:hypothetical protein
VWRQPEQHVKISGAHLELFFTECLLLPPGPLIHGYVGPRHGGETYSSGVRKACRMVQAAASSFHCHMDVPWTTLLPGASHSWLLPASLGHNGYNAPLDHRGRSHLLLLCPGGSVCSTAIAMCAQQLLLLLCYCFALEVLCAQQLVLLLCPGVCSTAIAMCAQQLLLLLCYCFALEVLCAQQLLLLLCPGVCSTAIAMCAQQLLLLLCYCFALEVLCAQQLVLLLCPGVCSTAIAMCAQQLLLLLCYCFALEVLCAQLEVLCAQLCHSSETALGLLSCTHMGVINPCTNSVAALAKLWTVLCKISNLESELNPRLDVSRPIYQFHPPAALSASSSL